MEIFFETFFRWILSLGMMLLMIGTLRVSTIPRRMAVFSAFHRLFMFTFLGIFLLVYFIAWHDVADNRDIACMNKSSPDGRFCRVSSAFYVYIPGNFPSSFILSLGMMLLMIGTLRVSTNPRRMAVFAAFHRHFMFTFLGIFLLVLFYRLA